MPYPFLAILGFVAGAIAGILKLVNKDPQAIIWLIIIAVLLIAADCIWRGWGRRAVG